MFQLFFFLTFLGFILYFFLPSYLLSIYRQYRGDCYWRDVRPYKKRYPPWLVVLAFLVLGLELPRLDIAGAFYLVFIALLLSLSWFDLKLRILPDRLLLALAIGGLSYHYFVLNSIVWLQLAMVMLWAIYAKILQVLMEKWSNGRFQPGFGAGDTKFVLALLCWFDAQSVLYLLFIACCLAIVVVMSCRLLSKKTVSSIAFGPFLSVAAYIIWWYG